MKDKLALLGEYLGHLAMGGVMYLALLVFGGAINKVAHYAAPMIGDSDFVTLIMWVEKFIMYADVAFIVWWALYSTIRAIREMMR